MNEPPFATAVVPAAYLRGLVILASLFVLGSIVFGVVVVRKLERVASVAESVNAKVDRAMAAAAPLGQAAVEKGVKAVENVDAEELGKSATSGVKEIGKAAKEHTIQWIKKHQAETQPAR